MKPGRLPVVALSLLLFSLGASAQFTGNLRLSPSGCELVGQCALQERLRFKDPSGTIWEAKAGLMTDGASIPGVFQPYVGSPFDEKFIKAAIIHDHYCDRHVRSWRQTHRVFFEALLDQGVTTAKAKTMYFAVLVGGPKWVKLIPGHKCGKNCINSMRSSAGVAGYRSRLADYSLPALPAAMQEVYFQLQAYPDSLSIEQLESRALQLRPDDFYFRNGDEIIASSPYITE